MVMWRAILTNIGNFVPVGSRKNGPMINEENPITEVPEDSCWGYLDTAEVGRLATSVNDQPEVFPVNYVVDGQSIVFRTAAGSKLEDIVTNNRVAFEADGWTEETGCAAAPRSSPTRPSSRCATRCPCCRGCRP